MGLDGLESTTPAAVAEVFGERASLAEEFVELLVRHGVERGLIGPREVDRLWERHILNSAVIGDHIPRDARVIDVGSGAGLPGVPLVISRPDLDMVLLEPMARRVEWLTEVTEMLDLHIVIERGRAEEKQTRARIELADVVTARAVAPLARLASWCLPLVRPGGKLVALKGASAVEEIERDRAAVHRAGGGEPKVATCGAGVLDTPSTVVLIERVDARKSRSPRGRASRDKGSRSR